MHLSWIPVSISRLQTQVRVHGHYLLGCLKSLYQNAETYLNHLQGWQPLMTWMASPALLSHWSAGAGLAVLFGVGEGSPTMSKFTLYPGSLTPKLGFSLQGLIWKESFEKL